MADAAKSQISDDSKTLHDLNIAVNRRNILVDDFRKLVRSCKGHDLSAEKVPGHFQRAFSNLESGFTGVDKSLADVSSSISSLGLASLLSTIPPTANNHGAPSEEIFQDNSTRKASLYEELICAYSSHERIVVDKIFRVIVVLRGYVVAGVNVRSSEEYFNMETKSLKPMDLWTPSAYEVFRVLTCNANAAMMYFYVPMNPESTFKSYLQWLNSFASLFSCVCRKCRKYLDQGMPPTWRDYRKLEPYHESCRTIAMTSM